MSQERDSGQAGFAENYAQMSAPELLHLAAAYDSLVEPAQDALRAEFTRRKMEPPLIEDEVLDSERLVTVRRYRDTSEAIVARSVLQSAGLYCFLRDENLVRLDWQVSNFIGGMSLQVRPEDQAMAEELLSQPVPPSIEYGAIEHEAGADAQAEYVQPHCPRCGSIEVTFEGADRSAAITSTFMLGLPLPLGGESWRCAACGCRWSDDGGSS
jgi:hypothetical protein